MDMRLSAALMSALALSAPALAQEQPTDSLADAMTGAMDYNPSLHSAAAQVEAARAAVGVSFADRLPQVNLNAAANDVHRSENPFVSTVRERPHFWIASINTSWLLYASGRLSASVRQSRAQLAATAADYQRASQQLLLDVTKAYTGVVLARSVKDAQERALANLQEQYRYVEANVNHGFLTQTDLAQARARVEEANANLAQADGQLIEANANYSRLVGHPPPALAPVGPLADLPASLDSALETAARDNPSILAAAAAVDAADAAVDFADANGRPRVSLEVNNSVFGEYDSSRKKTESEDTAALRFSVPIFQGGGLRARSRQQRALRGSAEFSLSDTQNQVGQQVRTAWASVISARASVTASTARLDAAELAQRGMQLEQRAGQRSVIDTLNQEQELLQARVDLARAQHDLVVAEYSLASSVGHLVEVPESAEH